MSAAGSTPSAAASRLTVDGRACRLPDSMAAIVARLTREATANEAWLCAARPRAARSPGNCSTPILPSTRPARDGPERDYTTTR